jgi:hypothetical protein
VSRYNPLYWWQTHGTKLLGFAQITVGVLAASTNVFPDHIVKYLILASGLLTAWRGYVNTLTAGK